MGKRRSTSSPVIVLVSLCLVASLMLAAAYQVTKPNIEANDAERLASQLKEVLPDASDFSELKEIEFLEGVKAVYCANNASGYVIVTSAKGFNDEITVMTGINSSGNIVQVKVRDLGNDANGVGRKTADEAFTKQFIGAGIITDNTEENGTFIEAVSGASLSSAAVFKAVKIALEQSASLGGVSF